MKIRIRSSSVSKRALPHCPICGESLLFLETLSYFEGDTMVYKCNSCLCTISLPIKISNTSKDVWKQVEPILSLKKRLILSGSCHGSVGKDYRIVYPKDAFYEERDFVYLYPEKVSMGMCGADAATVEHTLTPIKTGLFTVIEECSFRGHIETRIFHHILVEDNLDSERAMDVTIIDDEEYASMYTVLGHFELLHKIGYGGYCDVWKCRDQSDGKEYAIKAYTRYPLSDDMIESAISMYQLFAQFKNPNLLPIISCFSEFGHTYVLMPYCKAGSIESRRGRLSEQELWKLVRDIASGLAFIHKNDVIHMDIKPSNILFYQDRFVISDYGISVRMKEIIHDVDKTKTLGALSYMAPERFMSGNSLTSAIDIWALGATIYEMAVGTPPFNGLGGHGQIISKTDEINIGERYSSLLNDLVISCLSVSAASRPIAKHIVDVANRVLCTSKRETILLRETEQKHHDLVFRGHYGKKALKVYDECTIVMEPSNLLYGIIDGSGKVLVDYAYDSIHPFSETIWPGPGPLPPPDYFFLGAFFRKGEDVGYLYIREDGTISEYRKCPHQEFIKLCSLS